MMPDTSKGTAASIPVLSTGDVLRTVGPVADDTLLAILKCEPSVEDLEVASSYLRGEGSKVSRSGHPMSGKVAQLYDILSADPLYADPEE
jgi:hypothetical protein